MMLKGYERYVLSLEAKWYLKIPSTWKSTKMRTLFIERVTKVSDKDYQALSVGKMGVVPQLEDAVKTDNGDNRKLICAGDFAINSRSDRKGSSGISHYTGSCSLIITVLKPHDKLNREFFNYLLRSNGYVEEFYRNGHGLVSDLWTTKWQEMKNIFVPVPPKQEQDKIVQFLDWKISETNRFIHQKKKQNKLLEELKLTKINNLVTKGLTHDVKYKQSNVEWLGEIPEHWDVDHIKQHFKIKKRIAGKEGYDVLSITQQGIKKKDISSNEGQMAQSYANYQFVYPGDFAMNHMDLLTGYIDISKQLGVTSPDYRVFTLSDSEHCFAPFYLRVFQIGYKRKIFYKFGKGAANQGRWRLPITAFYDYAIQVPPIDEQREIARQCDEVEKQINEMISAINKEITLVEELRTKLISDVVTGQVDVRDVKIPAYETKTDIINSEDDTDEENLNESMEE